ncbi:hypothetical protein D3C72_1834490 [compost metagenome]
MFPLVSIRNVVSSSPTRALLLSNSVLRNVTRSVVPESGATEKDWVSEPSFAACVLSEKIVAVASGPESPAFTVAGNV